MEVTARPVCVIYFPPLRCMIHFTLQVYLGTPDALKHSPPNNDGLFNDGVQNVVQLDIETAHAYGQISKASKVIYLIE